jgi:hypothetical protein
MRALSSFAASADGLEPKWDSWPGDIGSKHGRDHCAVRGCFQRALRLSVGFVSTIQSRRHSRSALGGTYTFRRMVRAANNHHNGFV